VVGLHWENAPAEGSFAVIAQDARLAPPGMLRPDGGWNPVEGPTGSLWDGRYLPLSRRYDWLSTTATGDPGAVAVPSGPTGRVVAWFHQQDPAAIPFTDPPAQLLITIVHTDPSGTLRWARRLP
jgi:hypothetical protein